MRSLPRRVRPVLAVASLALVLAGTTGPGLASSPGVTDGVAAAALPGGALAQVGTVADPQTSPYEGSDYSAPDRLYSYPLGDDLGTVTVDEAARTLTLRTLDPADGSQVGSARTVTWDATWPIFGDLYAAPDGTFFLLVGQKNLGEQDSKPVVAVQHYDAGWSPVGSPATIKGGGDFGTVEGIRIPFDGAAPSLVQVGDRLVVHFARQIYGPTVDDRHQASYLAGVNIATMTATTFADENGENYGQTYASHSFRQLDAAAGDDLLVVDHGDTFPRSIQLGVYAGYGSAPHSQAPYSVPHNLFTISPGDILGDNVTGTTLDGVAASSTGSLTVGSSVPHGHAVQGVTGRDRFGGGMYAKNVWLVTAPSVLPDPENPADPDEQGTFTWLTDLDPNGTATVSEPRLVPLGSDRFALLFGVDDGTDHTVEYRLLDGDGTVLASESWAGWFSPASQPAVVGDRLEWLGHDAGVANDAGSAPAYLYGLDVSDPEAPVRLGADDPVDPQPSTDATLDTLDAVGARVTPRFDPAVTDYQARIKRRSSTATLSWLPNDAGATASYRIGSKPFAESDDVTVGVKPGRTKVVQVRVVAEDGTTTLTYTIAVTRRR